MRPFEIQRAGTREEGFTLVEMLVTLCVVALLGGIMVGALSSLGRMRAQTDQFVVEQELNTTLSYLQDLIANSQNRPLLTKAQSKASILGREASLRMVTIPRIASERFSLRDVELTLRTEGDLTTLIERHSARRDWREHFENEFEILSGVSKFELSYLASSGDAAPQWRQTWERDDRPEAIRINIEYLRNGRKIESARVISLDSRH